MSIPKPTKFRREIRRDGGYNMVPAYTIEEMQAVCDLRDELLAALERAVQSIIVFRNEQTLHRLHKLRASIGYGEMQNAMDEGLAAIASAKGGTA